MKKSNIITLIIIIAVIILAYFIISQSPPGTSEEIVKCIADNAILYTQLGCHACETQEDLFGENYQYLEIIDCFFERESCNGITATPTWEINGEKIEGVQSIEKLQELTGC